MISNPKLIKAGIFCGLLISVFLAGCNNQEQAAEFYTEAVMLNETAAEQEAIEKLKAAIELYPEFSMAHSMLGDMYFQTGQYEDSEKSYEQATKFNSQSFYDYFNLGKVRQVLKKFVQAAEAYVQACQLDPNSPDAHLNAAKCFFEVKDDEESLENALNYSLKAKELDADLGDVERLLGDIYQSRKDNELAIDAYKRALEAEGNKTDIMISLAVSYFRVGKNDSAKEVLDNIIAIDPQNNPAYRYLGYYHIRMNDFEGALENYLMAVQFDDKDWNSHKGLGVSYMLRAINTDDDQARQMAIDHWKKSLELNPRQDRLRELLNKYSKPL